MSICTKKALGKLNKRDLSLQSKVESANNGILEELCKMNPKFSQLETKNKVVKQANWLLSKRLVDMEGQCWANA